MGNYIDYTIIGARLNQRTGTALADESGSGVLDPAIVDPIIAQREEVFEGYARPWYDLPTLRTAKPPQAQIWIASMVIYDLFLRQSAVPADIANEYMMTMDQLKSFGKTGMPQLVAPGATTEVDQSQEPFASNMSADDIGDLTINGAALPWSEVL